MRSVNSTPLYSGVKRDRCKTMPNDPTFGDLPPPPRPPSAFQKKLIFNPPSFTIKQEFVDNEPSSPAPKLIKREYNVESNTFNEIFIGKETGSSEEESSSSVENSPTSSTGSATSTSIGGRQQIHSKNNHQSASAFAPKHFAPPKTFHFNEYCNSPKFNNNSPTLFSFNQNNNQPPPFCYNCKTFGHQKFECFNRWYSWWPIEYTNRYRWLRTKLYKANQLRRQGMMDRYMQEARKIEMEVEAEDRKRQNNAAFTQYRSGPPPQQRRNNNHGRYWGGNSKKGREDGQKILQAIRRVKPPTPPAGCPAQHKFDFDCHKLIEDLQRQVNQLRFTLTNIKSGSVSPPAKVKSLS